MVVIGGGLAGLFAAARQVQLGTTVHLWDPGEGQTASRVAAGLFNPITGKRWALSWMYDELYASLLAFFQDPLFQPLKRHLHRMPLWRGFGHAGDQNDWWARSAEPTYSHHVIVEGDPWNPALVHNPNGGLFIQTGGWLAVKPFLQDLAEALKQTGRFHLWKAELPYSQIDPQQKCIHWQGQSLLYDALIFAEGAAVKHNPWWNFLQLQPLKGQILTVRIPKLNLDRIITAPLYVVPQGKEEYLVGATYEHTYDHAEPTPEGRNELLTRLATVLPGVTPEVIDHQAGIRPTGPKGRRPCLGSHTQYPEMWFFNALGTKGVLIAPHFSLQLARWMWEPGYQPHPEVRLDRLLLPAA